MSYERFIPAGLIIDPSLSDSRIFELLEGSWILVHYGTDDLVFNGAGRIRIQSYKTSGEFNLYLRKTEHFEDKTKDNDYQVSVGTKGIGFSKKINFPSTGVLRFLGNLILRERYVGSYEVKNKIVKVKLDDVAQEALSMILILNITPEIIIGYDIAYLKQFWKDLNDGFVDLMHITTYRPFPIDYSDILDKINNQ